MPKGRIGLSLDEDVLAILNEHGRAEKLPRCPECRYQTIPGQLDAGHVRCPSCQGSGVVDDPRPPRYEIVQQGVRMWLEAKLGAGTQVHDGAYEAAERIPSTPRKRKGAKAEKRCPECGETEGLHRPGCECVHGIPRSLSCSDCPDTGPSHARRIVNIG